MNDKFTKDDATVFQEKKNHFVLFFNYFLQISCQDSAATTVTSGSMDLFRRRSRKTKGMEENEEILHMEKSIPICITNQWTFCCTPKLCVSLIPIWSNGPKRLTMTGYSRCFEPTRWSSQFRRRRHVHLVGTTFFKVNFPTPVYDLCIRW